MPLLELPRRSSALSLHKLLIGILWNELYLNALLELTTVAASENDASLSTSLSDKYGTQRNPIRHFRKEGAAAAFDLLGLAKESAWR